MKDFIVKHSLVILGLAIGALGGFLYWKYIGCTTGSCAITSKPLNSSVYGSMMGGLLFAMFVKEKPKEDEIQ